MVVVTTRKGRKSLRKTIIIRPRSVDVIERKCTCAGHSGQSSWRWKQMAIGLLIYLGKEIAGSLADTLCAVIKAMLGN